MRITMHVIAQMDQAFTVSGNTVNLVTKVIDAFQDKGTYEAV